MLSRVLLPHSEPTAPALGRSERAQRRTSPECGTGRETPGLGLSFPCAPISHSPSCPPSLPPSFSPLLSSSLLSFFPSFPVSLVSVFHLPGIRAEDQPGRHGLGSPWRLGPIMGDVGALEELLPGLGCQRACLKVEAVG